MLSIGYLGAIVVATLFMLYLDGKIGVMMLAFLLLMPLFSLAVTLWMRKTLTVTLQVPDTVAKQRTVSVVLRLEKKSPLPLPFLRFHFTADAHFDKLNPNAKELPDPPLPQTGLFANARNRSAMRKYRKRQRTQRTPGMLPLCVSMGIKRQADFTLTARSAYCGRASIALENFVLSDFLGMFHFVLPVACRESILIVPDIPQMKSNNRLFQNVSNAALTADEESDATPNFSAASTAGYEHRGYVPGDSLKRINWKLSSKRRQLMVRQDEPVSLAKLTVVLDFTRDTRTMAMRRRLSTEQQLIETALGLTMLCCQQGFPCTLCFLDAYAEWVQLTVTDPEQLACEAVTMLAGGFRTAAELGNADRLPPALQMDNSAIVLYFASHIDPTCTAALERLPAALHYILPELSGIDTDDSPNTHTLPNAATLWHTTDDNRLEPLQ